MRKLFLLSMLFAATVCNAQVVLWNGEDKEVDSDGGFWDRADPTVVEEGANKVMKFTLKANPSGWGDEHHNAALPLGDANLKGLRRLTMRLKMTDAHNVLVRLEGKGEAYNAERIAWYNGGNGWQVLVYEFAAGPEYDKITDTGNNVLSIWPYEMTAAGEGKTFYIDDIQLEGPMVNGSGIRALADNALTDQRVNITGSLSKGTYQCTWDGDWHPENYDDYTTLSSKISSDVCFLDLTGATVANGGSQKLRTKNPNLLILSPSDFDDKDNVIRWDEVNSRNNTPKMVLTDAKPFYTPIDFHADAVELTRQRYAGYNTFVLPFWVSATDLGASKVYTHKEGTTFKLDTDAYNPNGYAGANVPFLAHYADASSEVMHFSDKGVCHTPASFDGAFKGVYIPLGAGDVTGKWGINNEGKLQKGGASATISAFHAYLDEVPVSAREITIDDGEVTGIVNVNSLVPAEECVAFDLQGRQVAQPTRGLYIVNGKKIVVK